MKHDNVLFDVVNITVLVLLAGLMLYPFVNSIAVSFSSYLGYIQNPFMVWPHDLSVEGFKFVFKNRLIINSYGNTIIVTFAATIIALFLTTFMAYPLSKNWLKGRAFFMNYVLFTMLFSGGIIPNYNLIRSLGMLDSIWALILPGCVSAYNVMLMKSFFGSLPESLEEAARIDGASDLQVLLRVVFPLSLPIFSTIALFVAVGYWNSYFSAVLYIRSTDKWTLQLVLREILMSADMSLLASGGNAAEVRATPVETLRYATMVVAIVPIMCVYPFLQKYFVKGVTLGAVKG